MCKTQSKYCSGSDCTWVCLPPFSCYHSIPTTTISQPCTRTYNAYNAASHQPTSSRISLTNHLIAYALYQFIVMFPKTSLTFAVTLAILSAATPVVQDSGIRVSFLKRDGLTNLDGTFNHEEAVRQTARTHKSVSPLVWRTLYLCVTAVSIVKI